MKIIYQIGRLEPQMGISNFIYDEMEYKVELTSFALKKHFGNGTKLVLIYPVSLPLNRSLINEKSDLSEDLKKRIEKILANREEYLKSPKDFFEIHPHSKEADDFILIHSIGKYEGFGFETSYDDIVLEILFDMIERYLGSKFDELYVDISSGLNIYVSALLEATRHFSIFNRLQNWDTEKCKIYKVFSEPIIKSSINNPYSYQIYKTPVEFKAFYSSPIKKEDIDSYNLSRKIVESLFRGADNRKLKNKIQDSFENFAVHFSAIKNATPLVNYTFEFNEINSIEELLKEIIKLGKERLSENWQESPGLSKDNFLKTLLSLSFYEGIVKILKREGINPRGDGVSLDEIKKFKEIYKTFGLSLNTTFLGSEIRNLEEAKDNEGKKLIDKVSDSWESLDKFLYGESKNLDWRNFFAHAGFERTITEVRKCSGKLYFRYKCQEDNKLKDIKEELLNRI